MSRTLTELVPEGLSGERVDRIVAMLADVSRSVASRLVEQGAVTLNNKVVDSGSARVSPGETIVINLPDLADPSPLGDDSVEFGVVHEDNHVVVVDKPAWLVVHPGAGNPDSTLVNGILARYPEVAAVGEPHRPGIVHRLDRGTSGLLVVARTAEAYAGLVEQLSLHEPERIYTVLVWGHLDTPEGVIDAPIGRSTRHPTRMTVVQGGRPALTRYSVDRTFDEPLPTTLVTCRLETGRTHQIRVHLSAIGHPVVGDRDYRGGRPGIDPGRPFLHARSLTFRHPIGGETVEANSPLPDDLTEVLDSLG